MRRPWVIENPDTSVSFTCYELAQSATKLPGVQASSGTTVQRKEMRFLDKNELAPPLRYRRLWGAYRIGNCSLQCR